MRWGSGNPSPGFPSRDTEGKPETSPFRVVSVREFMVYATRIRLKLDERRDVSNSEIRELELMHGRLLGYLVEPKERERVDRTFSQVHARVVSARDKPEGSDSGDQMR